MDEHPPVKYMVHFMILILISSLVAEFAGIQRMDLRASRDPRRNPKRWYRSKQHHIICHSGVFDQIHFPSRTFQINRMSTSIRPIPLKEVYGECRESICVTKMYVFSFLMERFQNILKSSLAIDSTRKHELSATLFKRERWKRMPSNFFESLPFLVWCNQKNWLCIYFRLFSLAGRRLLFRAIGF